MCISLKVERRMSRTKERKEHLLVGNSPTLPVIRTVATIMVIPPITLVTKSFSWKLG